MNGDDPQQIEEADHQDSNERRPLTEDSVGIHPSARLHPLTMVKELGALAWAIVGAMVLPIDVPFVPAEVVDPDTFLAAAVLGYAVLRYLFTSYTVSPEMMELRKGVVVKTVQTMPRDRIQTVDVRTDILGRLFGVATVAVSAADTEQIKVSYVSQGQARQLRRLLEPSEAVGKDRSEEIPGAPLFILSPRTWLLYTVTETGFPASVIGLGVVLGFALTRGVSPWLLSVLPVVALPLLATTSMAGFRSWIETDRLSVVRGLISRNETNTPLARIQAVAVSRPPLRRAAGYETVGVVSGDISLSIEQATGSRVVAPLGRLNQWQDFVRPLSLQIELGEHDLQRSSRLTIRRSLVRGVAVTLVATVLAGALALWFDIGAVWAVLVLPIGTGMSLLYARLRYQVLGWVADDHYVLIRKGVVTRVLLMVPIPKVQDVTVQATYFQRRLGLATVAIDTAGVTMGHRVQAVDLHTDDAERLATHLARGAARVWLPDGV